MNRLKWLEDLEQRYHQLKPQGIKNQADFDRLNDREKSYLNDMLRLIDEAKALHARFDDFQFAFDHMPEHELALKVCSGRLKPEDKAAFVK